MVCTITKLLLKTAKFGSLSKKENQLSDYWNVEGSEHKLQCIRNNVICFYFFIPPGYDIGGKMVRCYNKFDKKARKSFPCEGYFILKSKQEKLNDF